MKKIYVIVGRCGAWDDEVRWNEIALTNEEKANEMCKKLNSEKRTDKWLGEHSYEVQECDLLED